MNRLLLLSMSLMLLNVVQGKRHYVGFDNTNSAPAGSEVITKTTTAQLGANLLSILGLTGTLGAGDTVLIACGKYYLTSELTIPAGVVVQGGYNPDATTTLTRTYPGAVYPSNAPTFDSVTILDGNSFFTPRDKKHRVATVHGTLETCYIRGGHTNELNGTTPEKLYGGGLYVDGGTVVACIIRGNVANNITSRATTPALGGGVYLTNGGKIYNSLIVNNMANNGYGVYGEAGCIITNATIIYNTFAPISVYVPGTGANLSTSNTTNYYYHQSSYVYQYYNTTVKVQLTDFYLGATETTCLQYCVFLAGVDYRVESDVIILADTYRDSLWTLKVYGAGITGQTDNKVVRLYYGTNITPSSQSDEDYCASNGYELCYTNPNSNVSGPDNFGFLYQNSGIVVPKEQTGDGTIPDDDISICYVSWYGSMAYCQWLGGSLPTEAQWEFALRRKNASAFVAPVLDNTTIAGQSSSLHNEAWAYDGGSSESVLNTYAWYSSNSADAATSAAYGSGGSMHNHKVGEKAPTGLGLYDMNGNLWEWFADLYRPSNYAISHYDYPSGNDMISGDVVLNPINNAFGVASPPVRYFCGGFWWSNNDAFRAGYRGSAFANSRGYHLGFRPAFLSPFAP